MAKKLKLSLEALEVESFTALPEGNERGTVVGYETDYDDTCVASCATCDGTCETCFNSCMGTCVGCRTNFGPNCATQKQTGPCGAC